VYIKNRVTVKSWLQVSLLSKLRDSGGVMDRVVAQLLAEIDGVQVRETESRHSQQLAGPSFPHPLLTLGP
jgi:hypothetical protein